MATYMHMYHWDAAKIIIYASQKLQQIWILMNQMDECKTQQLEYEFLSFFEDLYSHDFVNSSFTSPALQLDITRLEANSKIWQSI